MTADIAGDFTAASRVAHMDRVLQIERFSKLRQIVGVGVHVVAAPWLARSAMAAAVMGNAAVSARCQEKHLIFPGVCAERPAVAEHDGLSSAPIFVVGFDVPRIFFADSHVWHDRSPFYMGCARLPQRRPLLPSAIPMPPRAGCLGARFLV